LAVLGHVGAGTATTLADALDRIVQGGFEFAIIDRYLFDGSPADDAMRLLRQQCIPFLLTSGYSANDLGYEFDYVPYLQKPHGLEQLRVAIDKLRLRVQ
jgi:hypothetical protein